MIRHADARRQNESLNSADAGTSPLGFAETTLKEVLITVERDEAEAIDTLCSLLERVEKSRNFGCLPAVREVMKEWQNQPPGAIVRSLMKIAEQFEAQCPAHAKE